MIDRALVFLRDTLNQHLARGNDPGAALEDSVVFVEGDKLDPLGLKVGVVNAILVNLEQDFLMRRDDPFVRSAADGPGVPAMPDLRLSIWVLFVPRFHVYEAGLTALSSVLEYFQANRVFDRRSSPMLDPRIDRLSVELHTPSLSEQNDLWGSLKLAYHPSLLFKVRMIAVRGGDMLPAVPVSEPVLELVHADPTAP